MYYDRLRPMARRVSLYRGTYLYTSDVWVLLRLFSVASPLWPAADIWKRSGWHEGDAPIWHATSRPRHCRCEGALIGWRAFGEGDKHRWDYQLLRKWRPFLSRAFMTFQELNRIKGQTFWQLLWQCFVCKDLQEDKLSPLFFYRQEHFVRVWLWLTVLREWVVWRHLLTVWQFGPDLRF